jgi:thiamine pyrophosphokinase
MPDVVLGDLDSASAEVRGALEAAGAEVERFPREKDQTDTEIALLAAKRRGATQIELLGALGGARLDHALANVLLLALPSLRGVPVTLRDERHEVRLIRGGERLALAGTPGDLVTLLPLTRTVGGVTTTGLRYALQDGVLRMGSSRGVSNELTRKRATLSVGRGSLLVVTHHPSS